MPVETRSRAGDLPVGAQREARGQTRIVGQPAQPRLLVDRDRVDARRGEVRPRHQVHPVRRDVADLQRLQLAQPERSDVAVPVRSAAVRRDQPAPSCRRRGRHDSRERDDAAGDRALVVVTPPTSPTRRGTAVDGERGARRGATTPARTDGVDDLDGRGGAGGGDAGGVPRLARRPADVDHEHHDAVVTDPCRPKWTPQHPRPHGSRRASREHRPHAFRDGSVRHVVHHAPPVSGARPPGDRPHKTDYPPVQRPAGPLPSRIRPESA
ncbi:hypothetical protein EDD19_11223 [Dietzia cinnamea]|uniref:Uncharacterized protein n=1 Tax=Dietzia cinnamea TaxID=321318 RepID=A0A4R3ZT53_9ACTN|nr:hypothetical protein EDD19_11223 [Dietzia cinnamea]